MSWWRLGQGIGYHGTNLATYHITCAFCGESGSWELEHRSEKKKPNDRQILYFDTYKCGNCAGYVMVLWSTSGALHDYKVLPWPLGYTRHPKHWPDNIGRYWLQAKNNLSDENWDAAAVMTGSALQLALRSQGAEGKTLQEVDPVSETGA